MLPQLLIASSNAGKIKEFQHVLASKYQVLGLKDVDWNTEIVEDGQSFEENALIKARTLYRAKGIPVLADDSGLEVDALDGAPGIHTARYAGEGATDAQNRAKLLENLKACPVDQRGARFVCVLAWINAAGEEFLFRGECLGRILTHEVGDQGFGYDPVFSPEGSDLSFAQMEPQVKKAMSHRARAVDLWVGSL